MLMSCARLEKQAMKMSKKKKKERAPALWAESFALKQQAYLMLGDVNICVRTQTENTDRKTSCVPHVQMLALQALNCMNFFAVERAP